MSSADIALRSLIIVAIFIALTLAMIAIAARKFLSGEDSGAVKRQIIFYLLFLVGYIGLSYLGGYYFVSGIMALSVIAFLEAIKILRKRSPGFVYYATSIIGFTAFWFIVHHSIIPASFCIAVAAILMLFSTITVFAVGRLKMPEIFVAPYIVLSFIYLVLLNSQDNSVGNLIFILAVVYSTDHFAYLGGKLLGNTKLLPRVSPNKTAEGFLAGLAMGTLTGWLFKFCLPGELSLAQVLLLSVSMSLLGQAGDLLESAIKRKLHIKNLGTFIPVDGGILDRFDSFLFAAPLFYYAIALLQ